MSKLYVQASYHTDRDYTITKFNKHVAMTMNIGATAFENGKRGGAAKPMGNYLLLDYDGDTKLDLTQLDKYEYYIWNTPSFYDKKKKHRRRILVLTKDIKNWDSYYATYLEFEGMDTTGKDNGRFFYPPVLDEVSGLGTDKKGIDPKDFIFIHHEGKKLKPIKLKDTYKEVSEEEYGSSMPYKVHQTWSKLLEGVEGFEKTHRGWRYEGQTTAQEGLVLMPQGEDHDKIAVFSETIRELFGIGEHVAIDKFAFMQWKHFGEITSRTAAMTHDMLAGRETRETPKVKYEGLYVIKSATDFIKDYKPNTWLIEDILPSSELGECFGASQSRKTFVMLDQAVCIQHGMDWQGHKCQQEDVLYICGEGVNGVRARIAAFHTHYKVDSSIDILDVPVDMMSNDSMKELALAITQQNKDYGLIIIDTLNANFRGEENSADDFGTMKDTLKEYICNDARMVLWVHHTGNTEATRGRGSSARFAGVDFSMQVEAKGALSTVKSRKMKDAEHFEDIVLAFEEVDCNLGFEGKTSLVPVLADMEDIENNRSGADLWSATGIYVKEAMDSLDPIPLSNMMIDTNAHIIGEDVEGVMYKFEDIRADVLEHYEGRSQWNKWLKVQLEKQTIAMYLTQDVDGKEKLGYIYFKL